MFDIEHLKTIKEEYNSLNEKLMSPDQLTGGMFKITSSRLSQIQPIVENFDKYTKIQSDIEEAKTMLEEESDKELQELAKEELKDEEEKLSSVTDTLTELLTKSDPNDARDVILEIRAGTGGEEAALFAGDLFRMYTKYAETQNWKIELLSTNRLGNGGYKEVIAQISGDSVFGELKYENGVHRVQRIPSTESSGRVHTSAASIVTLPVVDDVEVELKDEDLKFDVYRAGGPGGQSVNTTDSAVRVTHLPTNLVVTCQDQKSQHKNKAKVISILKSKLFELEQAKKNEAESDIRQSAIKSGDRSAKIRTYNFPQNRVTDHRIKQSWYNLSNVLDGELAEIIEETHKGLLQLSE